jgi:signal transduction histidine kinase
MISFVVFSIVVLGSMVSSFCIFSKSIQYSSTASQKFIAIAWCLLWSFAAGSSFIPLSIIRTIACFASVIFVFFLTRQRLETVVSAYLLSFGISLVLYYIALVPLAAVITLVLGSEHAVDAPIDFNEPIYVLLYTAVAVLQLALAFLLFRIKRFRKGFPFIFNKFAIVTTLFFTGIVLILVTWVNMISQSEESVYIGLLYITGVLISGISIYILIRRLIKMFQRKRAEQNSAEHYKQLLAESEERHKEKDEFIAALTSKVHNFTDRISAMESYAKQCSVEFAEDIQGLKQDWQGELAKIKTKKPLPTTKIRTIDNLFQQFAWRFANEDVAFNLVVNGSIIYMIENIIKTGDLETLIVNHLNDAKKAVNSSDNSFRSITAVIGVKEEHYEFTVFDSGIPFKVDTLIRLGTERVTTHAESGGSGIGFETTFKTMRETGASLIINEKEPSAVGHSKSVTIRFDGKSQYIIETYRADEFPKSDRFIVIPTAIYAEMT